MGMDLPEQYLAALQAAYLRGTKKQKRWLLDEARKRTKLNRKALIRQLSQRLDPTNFW